MVDIIERYIYDVTRRLPENEREEVSRELNANIHDMLSDNFDQEGIKTVLYELGSPAILADKYRQKPRYLISPAVYDDYIRVLKWIIPLVGVILLVIGLVYGGAEVFRNGDVLNETDIAQRLISNGISFGIDGALQALIWVTVGFIIADRVGYRKDKNDWKIEDLPDILPADKHKISLADSIVELVMIAFGATMFILLCLEILPSFVVIRDGGMQFEHLFSRSFVAFCIPVVIISAVIGMAECIAKIVVRRWNPTVCAVTVVSNLVSIGAIIALCTRPIILSEEFSSYLNAQEWLNFNVFSFMGNTIENPIRIIIVILVTVICIISSIAAIRHTIKTSDGA